MQKYIVPLTFAILVSVVVATLPKSPFDYVTWAPEGGNNVQSWFSATGSWVAALIAGWTGFLIYGQLKEQRKQNEFLLGDALPTIGLYEKANENGGFQYKIVNWNRRSFIFTKLEITGSYDIGKWDGQFTGPYANSIYLDDHGNLSPSKILPGWEDRTLAPKHFIGQLELQSVTETSKAELQNSLNEICKIRVTGYLDNTGGRPLELSFEAPISELVYSK